MTTGQIIFAIISAVVAITGLTITGMGIMLRRAKKKGADEHRLNTLESRVDNLQCVSHQANVTNIGNQLSGVIGTLNEHTSKIESLGTDMVAVKLDLAEIRGDIRLLMVKVEDRGNPLAKRKSPISLTELGLKIADELKIKEKIVANWSAIAVAIDEGVKDKNAYDIQEYCIRLATIDLERLFTPKDMEEIKLHAFRQGDNVATYGLMIGVLLRDEYFRLNNINAGELDKFSRAPAN